MQLSRFLKGQIHVTDFDDMPFYKLHSIYYDYWIYTEEEKKKTDKEKQADAMNTMIEDSI